MTQLPLFQPPLAVTSTFEEILVEPRRERWAAMLRLLRRNGILDAASLWSDGHECSGCVHRRGRGWCSLMDLPATVNPVLSYRGGIPGMACMGMGRTAA
jgi:hypothetical protein